MNQERMTPERIAVFVFGAAFTAAMLLVALFCPNPTEAQWRVFNIVMALAAGAVTAFLPGALHVRITPWLRAGGSLAVFALVFLVKPAGLVATAPIGPMSEGPPLEQARTAATEQLERLDAFEFDRAYDVSFEGWRMLYKKGDFVKLGTSVREPLGSVSSRVEVGQTGEDDLLKRVHIHSIEYVTKFSNLKDPIREIVIVAAPEFSKSWIPSGYLVDVPASALTR